MECDETQAVLERAHHIDATCSREAIARYLAEMVEAATQLQQVSIPEASDLPVAFSATWPDDAQQ